MEGGPDCFLSEKPWAMELIKRLGIETGLPSYAKAARQDLCDIIRGNSASPSRRRDPHGADPACSSLATSSLITIPGKIRMALEFLFQKEKKKQMKASETLCGGVEKEALDKIAEPLVAGVTLEAPRP